PRRAHSAVVPPAADQRRAPVRGQRHAGAEVALAAALITGGQLRSLLAPTPGAREYPRRPRTGVVELAADQRRAPVRRKRHASELRLATLVASGQLRSLLGPGAAGAREDPR